MGTGDAELVGQAEMGDRIKTALKAGKSQRTIEHELGVTRHQVRRVAADLKQTSTATHARASVSTIRGIAGRQSQDRPGRQGLGGIIERLMGTESGALVGVNGQLLDADAMESMPIRKLVDIAVEASPEINRARWDFLRMFASGFEFEVFKAGTEEPDEAGEALLKAFRDQLGWKHGDESVIYLKLGIAAWTRGAMVMELVMDDAGRMPVDIATPDPSVFSFKLIDGDWVIGQRQQEGWVPMDRPTFRHIQIDPRPGRPEGSAPMGSALFPALMLLGIMQDLRRVIANQGYPRLDAEIDVTMLNDLITGNDEEGVPQLFEDGTDLSDLLDQVMGTVSTSLENVPPGGNYVHGSHVKLNPPIGALGSDLSDVEPIIGSLERMSARALKTSPAFFGITEGGSESTANRQWEQLVGGVEAMQRPAERLIESIYTLALQAMGKVCTVKFRFAKIRATEELRDEQTRTAKIGNVRELMDMGMMTPNQAAQELTGDISPAVELTYETPDGSAAGTQGADTSGNDVPSTDALGLDGENAGRNPFLRRVLPVVATNTSVSTEDEKQASADFDETVPTLADMLEADPK